jgi:hypothetical protein
VVTWLAAAILALGLSQDKPAPKDDPEDLTPEKALEMLKEVQGLMTRSEDLLNDSSRGQAVETEDVLLKRINELLRDDPAAAQKKVLEKIAKLMEKSEGSQKDAIERMAEILRKAKACQGGSCQKPGEQGRQSQPGQLKPVQQPGDPARAPYDPNRLGSVEKFKSQATRSGNWGNLPSRLREAMQVGRRAIDDFPAEYQQILKEYMKKLAEDKE